MHLRDNKDQSMSILYYMSNIQLTKLLLIVKNE
jgi:hypothetical protein